jgi:hypothetical protein
MFVFNRIWMYFPDWNVEKYRDFYGGFSLRLNLSTFLRILECGLFLMLGYGLRERQRKGGAATSSIQPL